MANNKAQPKRMVRKRKAAAVRKTPVSSYHLHPYLRQVQLSQEEKYRAPGRKLAAKYGIEDANAMSALLLDIHHLQHESSRPYLDENWALADDLTSWPEARPKLQMMATAIGNVNKILKQHDDTIMAALFLSYSKVNVELDLPTIVRAVAEFEFVLLEAASIVGKKGNRPLAAWKYDAAHLCQVFWFKQKGEKPRRYFGQTSKPTKGEKGGNRVTTPGNDFCRLFCDVMSDYGVSASECDTLLRKSK